tara:strand:+ start:288 stop:605 length:318 start_codon:yes stop_codon:yes gene_type:complete
MSVVTLSDQNDLHQMLKSSNSLCILYFTAAWCGPCKSISPIIDEYAQQFHNCLFIKIDVDQLKSLTEKFNVTKMPTFLCIKNNTIKDRMEGANKDKLLQLIHSNL